MEDKKCHKIRTKKTITLNWTDESNQLREILLLSKYILVLKYIGVQQKNYLLTTCFLDCTFFRISSYHMYAQFSEITSVQCVLCRPFS